MKNKEKNYNVARTLAFWFILITGCIGIPIVFRLKKHFAEGALRTRKLKGGYLIICNHREWVDVPVLCLVYYRTCLKFLATKKIFVNRFASGFLSAMGAIPVDKEHIDFSPINRLISSVKNGNACVIFPEGGLRNNNEISKFKDGVGMVAALSKVAVIPHYKTKFRAFHRNYIAIGKPIYFSDYFETYTAANVSAFTSILEDEVRKLKNDLDDELWQKGNISFKQ